MKKKTKIIAVVLMVVVVGVVALYAYLSTRQKEALENAKMTAAQMVLSRDLQKDYPPTVKQVVACLNDIQKCLYNEECTDEEIEQLGMYARNLYDAELLENNEATVYVSRLREEVSAFQSAKMRINRISLASSNNVETFQEDGFEFARIHCSYYISDGGVLKYQDVVYLLRRDENRQWKVYGWDRVEDAKNAGETGN